MSRKGLGARPRTELGEEATYDEAYQHLAQAERLQPGFYANNRLLLAQCCHQMGRRDEAHVRWLKALRVFINAIAAPAKSWSAAISRCPQHRNAARVW